MPKIRIPEPWRKHTGGEALVEVSGETVGPTIDALTSKHPELRNLLFDNGDCISGTGESVNVLLGMRDFRELDGANTPVSPADKLMILRTWPAAMSGPQGG